jgi:hypothetical protein
MGRALNQRSFRKLAPARVGSSIDKGAFDSQEHDNCRLGFSTYNSPRFVVHFVVGLDWKAKLD